MATTNQKIADLCGKGGFKLPEEVTFCDTRKHGEQQSRLVVFGHSGDEVQSAAYDLIAAEFARQTRFKIDIAGGDSEAAIDALWKAVCDG